MRNECIKACTRYPVDGCASCWRSNMGKEGLPGLKSPAQVTRNDNIITKPDRGYGMGTNRVKRKSVRMGRNEAEGACVAGSVVRNTALEKAEQICSPSPPGKRLQKKKERKKKEQADGTTCRRETRRFVCM